MGNQPLKLTGQPLKFAGKPGQSLGVLECTEGLSGLFKSYLDLILQEEQFVVQRAQARIGWAVAAALATFPVATFFAAFVVATLVMAFTVFFVPALRVRCPPNESPASS